MKFPLFIFLCFLTLNIQAQVSKQFSQYVFTGLTVNPAYAGYKEDWNLNTIYRQQWQGIPGSPRTSSITLDGCTNLASERVGLGLELTNENLGAQSNTDFYGSYAYRLPLNSEGTSRLCLGLALGFSQYAVNGSAFLATNAGDKYIPMNSASTLVPDARFGIYYYTPDYYLGGSLLGLFNATGSRQRMGGSSNEFGTVQQGHQLYLTAGGIIPLSENLNLKPSLMVKENFKGSTAIDANLFLLVQEKIWIGTSYRRGIYHALKNNLQSGLEAPGGMSAMFEFYATDNLRLGYAYDFTTSGISGYQSGSHELSLSLTMLRKRRPGLICPHYF